MKLWYECDTCSETHWQDANDYTPEQLAEVIEAWQQAGFKAWAVND